MACYSKSGDQDSREAEAKDSKKQPVKEDCCTSLNVHRLEDATVSLEKTSSVSVINCDVFPGSEKRGRKSQYEEPHNLTKIKKCAYEQTSGKVEERSITRTTNNSEVSYSCSVDVSDISECERVPKCVPDVPVGIKMYHMTCIAVQSLKRKTHNV